MQQLLELLPKNNCPPPIYYTDPDSATSINTSDDDDDDGNDNNAFEEFEMASSSDASIRNADSSDEDSDLEVNPGDTDS
jgi:hypothetical protein